MHKSMLCFTLSLQKCFKLLPYAAGLVVCSLVLFALWVRSVPPKAIKPPPPPAQRIDTDRLQRQLQEQIKNGQLNMPDSAAKVLEPDEPVVDEFKTDERVDLNSQQTEGAVPNEFMDTEQTRSGDEEQFAKDDQRGREEEQHAADEQREREEEEHAAEQIHHEEEEHATEQQDREEEEHAAEEQHWEEEEQQHQEEEEHTSREGEEL
jgi:hypothetical protein